MNGQVFRGFVKWSRGLLLTALAVTASGAFGADLCSNLLTLSDSSVGEVDVAGAPGLRILSGEIAGLKADYQTLLHHETDAYHPHELSSSARYAKVIHERNHEILLMVPDIDHRSVPGFDGVILNEKGEAIANYSLKTLLTARDAHAPMNRARVGIEKAEKYSFADKWISMLKIFIKDEDGSLRVGHTVAPGEESTARRWYAKAAKLFGITDGPAPKRPTRVVVDITTEAPMPDEGDIATIKGWIHESGGLIESIIFLKDGVVLEVR